MVGHGWLPVGKEISKGRMGRRVIGKIIIEIPGEDAFSA